MGLAAKYMGLTKRVERLLERFLIGTDGSETLAAIRQSTFMELREQTLGVTQQFFEVHRWHDKPMVFVCLETNTGRPVGHDFVAVEDES